MSRHLYSRSRTARYGRSNRRDRISRTMLRRFAASRSRTVSASSTSYGGEMTVPRSPTTSGAKRSPRNALSVNGRSGVDRARVASRSVASARVRSPLESDDQEVQRAEGQRRRAVGDLRPRDARPRRRGLRRPGRRAGAPSTSPTPARPGCTWRTSRTTPRAPPAPSPSTSATSGSRSTTRDVVTSAQAAARLLADLLPRGRGGLRHRGRGPGGRARRSAGCARSRTRWGRPPSSRASMVTCAGPP